MSDIQPKGSLFNIDSIYRNMGQFGTISIKHRVNLFAKDRSGKAVPYGKIYTSQKSNGGVVGYPSVAFRASKDSIILESGFSYDKRDSDSIRKPKSILLSYDDIADVKRIFMEASSWFFKDPYKNELFKYDEKTGIPFGIAQKYETLNTTCDLHSGIRGSFIAIKPNVISDPLNSIGYPGVVIYGQQGLIGSCTMTEFLNLKDLVINSLNNLYLISMELINQYLLGQIGGKH